MTDTMTNISKTRKTIRFLISFIGTIFAASLLSTSIYGESLADESMTAREIMQASNDVEIGDNATQDLNMVIIGEKGGRKENELVTFRQKAGAEGEDIQSVMFFIAPAKHRNIALLAYDYDDDNKKDKQWMYLPAIRKSKRITGSAKSRPFMGSDFSYADLAVRNISSYDYRILNEETLHGHNVWVIEAIPVDEDEINETGYVKSIMYVRKDNFIVIRSINTLRRANRQKVLDVVRLEVVDGIWVPMEITMRTEKSGVTLSYTTLTSSNVKFDQDIPDQMFSLRSIERGL